MNVFTKNIEVQTKWTCEIMNLAAVGNHSLWYEMHKYVGEIFVVNPNPAQEHFR